MLKFRYLKCPNITISMVPDLVVILRVPKFSLFRPVINSGTTFIFSRIPSFLIKTRFIKLPITLELIITLVN